MSPPAASESRSLFAFVSLVFGLSIPFYVAGAVTDYRLLPGLPVSALALVCPMIAALILIYRRQHAAGIMALLRRSFEYRRIKPKWYLPILFLMPCVTVAGYAICVQQVFRFRPLRDSRCSRRRCFSPYCSWPHSPRN